MQCLGLWAYLSTIDGGVWLGVPLQHAVPDSDRESVAQARLDCQSVCMQGGCVCHHTTPLEVVLLVCIQLGLASGARNL
jgi:hypothetical protein